MEAQEDLPRVLAEALRTNPAKAIDRDMIDRLACSFIDDDPQVWLQCKQVLKQHRLIREVEPRVKLRGREIRGVASIGGAPSREQSISELWPGAPVGSDVYAPNDYSVQNGSPAIERLEQRMMGDSPYERRIPVCLDPVVITRRIGHVQQRSLLLEIQFRTTNGWRKLVVERDIALNARKIVDTARQGVPVRSGNAMELTEWLGHYEQVNRDRIPIGYASSSMGWQGEDDNPTHHGFMCGTRQIGANGRAIELEGSDGDMSDAREIHSYGTFEAWRDTVARLIHFPAVKIGVLASLAAPLIAIVQGPNGVIEWAGRTSTGKSTVLKVAQSCWRSASNQMATWNTTIIGIEAAAQFLCDMPLIIDDTSAAVDGGRSQSLGKVIYQLVSGRARGRATRDGGQRIRSRWRTLVLATGETPLGELAKAEGASARVLTFWSAPLGETTPETGALASDCLRLLGENYGHAGPRFVQWLCDNREQWDAIRQHYAEATGRVRSTLCSPAASRLAEIVALLDCAAWVGRESGCTPWITRSLLEEKEIVDALMSAMTLATSSADRAYDAWEYAVGEAHARPRSWIPWGTDPESSDRDPPGGWLGYRAAEEWAWFPQQLRKVLEQGKFTPEAALRAWKDLDVLIKPERSRYTSQVRPKVDRSKLRLIRIKDSYPGYEMDPD